MDLVLNVCLYSIMISASMLSFKSSSFQPPVGFPNVCCLRYLLMVHPMKGLVLPGTSSACSWSVVHFGYYLTDLFLDTIQDRGFDTHQTPSDVQYLGVGVGVETSVHCEKLPGLCIKNFHAMANSVCRQGIWWLARHTYWCFGSCFSHWTGSSGPILTFVDTVLACCCLPCFLIIVPMWLLDTKILVTIYMSAVWLNGSFTPSVLTTFHLLTIIWLHFSNPNDNPMSSLQICVRLISKSMSYLLIAYNLNLGRCVWFTLRVDYNGLL